MAIRFFVVTFVIVLSVGVGQYLKKKNMDYFSTGFSSAILKKVPDVKLENVYTGELVSFKDLKRRKNIFVHFWATWCGPCEVEFPGLMQLTKTAQVSSQNLFVFVAVNDDKKKVKKFLDRFKAKGNPDIYLLIDNEGLTEEKFGVFKLPETFVFNSLTGDVKHKFTGPQEWTSNHFTRTLSR